MSVFENEKKPVTKDEDRWGRITGERDRNRKWLEDRLFDIDYPGLYLGDEMNTFSYDWDSAVRDGSIDGTWKIVIANLMASGASLAAPALSLFYQEFHEYRPDWIVERSLCPPTGHDQELMRADGIRPFAVESKMPLEAFDVMCLSMDLSVSFVAVPWMIMNSGIPLYASERSDEDSFVVLGGSALVNPEPYRPFCDIMFMGEGEEVLPELLEHLENGRRHGLSREEILLDAVRRWDCLYAPRFYEERFSADGRFEGTFPVRDDVPGHVKYYRVPDLDDVFVCTKPILTFCTDAASTVNFEISRGCEGKCAFCLGGFTTLPYRSRSAELVRSSMETIIHETGNTNAIPVSFNSVSHPEINRIVTDLTGMLGDNVRLVSMRMDGFHDNPELCCFISMQKRGRIAFGVEGASQRLRDLVCKNLSEEQILDTMREICHSGYALIKFMMICNLPTESEADLDELYELAVKIRDVFEEETPPGGRVPKLLFSWNSLKVSPHTPLQWAGVNNVPMPAYEDFAGRVREIGFASAVHDNTADNELTNLLIRGDERLASLLEYLAEEGDLRHSEAYTDEVYDKTLRFLDERHLPPADEWFRGYGLDEPLPWDIVEGPASKEYLKSRYRDIAEGRGRPDPICTESCSGCGACDSNQRAKLQSMPAGRKKDRLIDLHHPVRKDKYVHVQHVLLKFTYDRMHSVVIPSYWDCEIRRALYRAGIEFDPESIECYGSRSGPRQAAMGYNVTNISLCGRYDIAELKRLIDEHAVNFRVVSAAEIDRPLRVTSSTYRIALPEGTDKEKLKAELTKKLAESEWVFKGDNEYFMPHDYKKNVLEAGIQGDCLVLKVDLDYADLTKIFGYLIAGDKGGVKGIFPERTDMSFEKKGAIDLAMTREMRDAYIRSLGEGAAAEAAALYISGNQCCIDLDKLIARNYSFVSKDSRFPEDRDRLLDLISFASKVSVIPEEDDPALKDLKAFLG